MAKPDTHRADRLYAIWQRRSARFREAHYAYRLADEHCDRVGRTHASRAARALASRAARALASRAARVMDILHRQTAKLARLQIAALGLAAAAAATPATAADEWTAPQASVGDVDKHFAVASLIGAAALHALPTRYRDWALNAGLVIEAGCVANNLRLGIGIKF